MLLVSVCVSVCLSWGREKYFKWQLESSYVRQALYKRETFWACNTMYSELYIWQPFTGIFIYCVLHCQDTHIYFHCHIDNILFLSNNPFCRCASLLIHLLMDILSTSSFWQISVKHFISISIQTSHRDFHAFWINIYVCDSYMKVYLLLK